MTEPTRTEPNRASGSPLRVPLLLAAAAAALYVAAGSTRDFWAPDEPDFAQQTREMLERRDLLIPYQNGKPYSEKPPLFYWAIAATTPFSGGDVAPAATRVPSAVAAGFLVFAAAWLAGRRGGTKDALLAGAMTATAPLVFWQGQFLQIDALFAALVAAAFLAQYVVWNEPGRARPAAWAFPLLLAAGILTKGPLVLVLCGLVALAECALRRSWKPLLDLRPFRGALLVVLLVVPWYVAASLSGGREYAYDLIVNQNWNRFFRPFDHVQPWWFYAEAIWGDFAPWTLAVLVGAVALARGGALGTRADLRFAATVLLTCFLFLSASGAKQGKYLLMAHPFAAVLLAASLARADASAASLRRFFRGYALVAGLLLAAGAVVAPLLVRSRFPAHAALVPYVAVPLGVGGLGAAAVALRRRSASPAFLALA
ncbi:MAG TPA: glycosyltransferase family 39 protein, partial [Thermoanaerobaculia bacterium]|nr:glycosyltransferase family 39 protein [Thermoanaerobaculia bacterium]